MSANSSRKGNNTWVGPTIAAPTSQSTGTMEQRARSTANCGRQRHYGCVELAVTGEKVFVDDVVEVSSKTHPSASGKKSSAVKLVQVGRSARCPCLLKKTDMTKKSLFCMQVFLLLPLCTLGCLLKYVPGVGSAPNLTNDLPSTAPSRLHNSYNTRTWA